MRHRASCSALVVTLVALWACGGTLAAVSDAGTDGELREARAAPGAAGARAAAGAPGAAEVAAALEAAAAAPEAPAAAARPAGTLELQRRRGRERSTNRRPDDSACLVPPPAGNCQISGAPGMCNSDSSCTAGTNGRCVVSGRRARCACIRHVRRRQRVPSGSDVRVPRVAVRGRPGQHVRGRQRAAAWTPTAARTGTARPRRTTCRAAASSVTSATRPRTSASTTPTVRRRTVGRPADPRCARTAAPTAGGSARPRGSAAETAGREPVGRGPAPRTEISFESPSSRLGQRLGGVECLSGPLRSAAFVVRSALQRPHAAPRASWDEYFMNIAREVSTRSTCDRKFVGAVIVRDKSILATGYNGSIRGLPHCDEEGHLMEDGHCVRTVHAEANAIVQAARNGVRIEGATIYVTASPCWGCFRLIANAGQSDASAFGEGVPRHAHLRGRHAPRDRAGRHSRQERCSKKDTA